MPTYHREFGWFCGEDDPFLEQVVVYQEFRCANGVLAYSNPQTQIIESAEAGWASINPAETAQLVPGAYI
jgi:hypothetical protein